MLDESDAGKALQLVTDGQPPLAIRKYFKSFKDAVQFYSEFQAKMFDLGSATQSCCACERPAGDIVVEIQWAAPFSVNSLGRIILILVAIPLHVHIGSKTQWIGFSGFHGFCPACWRRYRRLRILKGFLEAITLLLVFGGIAFAAGFGTAPLVLDHLSSTNRLELWLACAGCAATALLGGIVRVAYRQMGVPKPIRIIAPRPFQLIGSWLMQKVILPGPPPITVHVPKYRPQNARSMSWQQTVGVLVTIFGLVPGLIMSFASHIDPPYRMEGYEIQFY